MAGDWRSATVAELQRDGILLVEDGNHGEYRPRQDEFVDQGVAFIRAADMDAGRVLFESAAKINELARKRITKGIGAPGDVLLSHKGTVGKLALVPDEAPAFVCSPQTTFWRSRNEDILDRKYLYAYLRSPRFIAQLATRAGETDMAPYVSLTSQRGLSVILPPIDEQRTIASLLGALEDKIELNRQMNETLEATARLFYKDWFVDFCPTRAKAEGRPPYLAPELWALFPNALDDDDKPVGWNIITAEDFCLSVRDGTHDSPKPHDTGHYLITSRHIVGGELDLSKAYRISETDYVEINRRSKVDQWDVLITMIGTVGETLLVREQPNFAIKNIGLFKSKCRIYGEWFYLYLNSPATQNYITAHQSGTTQSYIPLGQLRQIPLIEPSAQVLHRFGEVICPLSDQITQNIVEIKNLAQTRDLLLPKLMSGEIRLRDAEKMVEAVA